MKADHVQCPACKGDPDRRKEKKLSDSEFFSMHSPRDFKMSMSTQKGGKQARVCTFCRGKAYVSRRRAITFLLRANGAA